MVNDSKFRGVETVGEYFARIGWKAGDKRAEYWWDFLRRVLGDSYTIDATSPYITKYTNEAGTMLTSERITIKLGSGFWERYDCICVRKGEWVIRGRVDYIELKDDWSRPAIEREMAARYCAAFPEYYDVRGYKS